MCIKIVTSPFPALAALCLLSLECQPPALTLLVKEVLDGPFSHANAFLFYGDIPSLCLFTPPVMLTGARCRTPSRARLVNRRRRDRRIYFLEDQGAYIGINKPILVRHYGLQVPGLTWAASIATKRMTLYLKFDAFCLL
ncbi:hypothetical protein K438DRAFT_1749446 [Mycena galopus ATCC 62051]|nr:hypothetical protein K438DRAFT_1749446 [Mycena galopus ATCC 62051]